MICYENSPHDVEIHPDGLKPRIVEATIRRGPWKGNNRRTDYWFYYNGSRWHGHCGENGSTFWARKIRTR